MSSTPTTSLAWRLLSPMIFRQQEYYNHTGSGNFMVATSICNEEFTPPCSQPHRNLLCSLVGDRCRGGKGSIRVPADSSRDPVQCPCCCSAPLPPRSALPHCRETCCFHLALASGCHEPGLFSYSQSSGHEQPPHRHHKATRKPERQEGLTHALRAVPEIVATFPLVSPAQRGARREPTSRSWSRRESS